LFIGRYDEVVKDRKIAVGVRELVRQRAGAVREMVRKRAVGVREMVRKKKESWISEGDRRRWLRIER